VIINVHHFSQQIVDCIRQHPFKDMSYIISDESDKLLDTGGGLKKAMRLLSENEKGQPLIVHNVDILDNADFSGFYNQYQTGVDALLMVSNRQTKRYFLFDENNRLVGWTNIETGEVKTPFPQLNVESCKKMAFAGMHLVTENVANAMSSCPDKFGITDFYISQCARLCIKGYSQTGFQMVDVGKLDTLRQAEKFYEKFYKV
jgi:N-acetyl-alpha-D-muramate 1-phosphate uridylyltransferase